MVVHHVSTWVSVGLVEALNVMWQCASTLAWVVAMVAAPPTLPDHPLRGLFLELGAAPGAARGNSDLAGRLPRRLCGVRR